MVSLFLLDLPFLKYIVLIKLKKQTNSKVIDANQTLNVLSNFTTTILKEINLKI